MSNGEAQTRLISNVIHRNSEPENTDQPPSKISKTVCFLHSCTLSVWGTEILDDMLVYFKDCGIFDTLDYLFINNVGDKIDVDKYSQINPKIIAVNYSSDASVFENCTLRQMYFFRVSIQIIKYYIFIQKV